EPLPRPRRRAVPRARRLPALGPPRPRRPPARGCGGRAAGRRRLAAERARRGRWRPAVRRGARRAARRSGGGRRPAGGPRHRRRAVRRLGSGRLPDRLGQAHGQGAHGAGRPGDAGVGGAAARGVPRAGRRLGARPPRRPPRAPADGQAGPGRLGARLLDGRQARRPARGDGVVLLLRRGGPGRAAGHRHGDRRHGRRHGERPPGAAGRRDRPAVGRLRLHRALHRRAHRVLRAGAAVAGPGDRRRGGRRGRPHRARAARPVTRRRHRRRGRRAAARGQHLPRHDRDLAAADGRRRRRAVLRAAAEHPAGAGRRPRL
ncbi:MAG: D-alanine--D-alanine ligase, partial [uncultured Frankineae bacterium]